MAARSKQRLHLKRRASYCECRRGTATETKSPRVFVRPAALSNYRRTHSERLGQFFDFDERTLHRRFISRADGRQPLIHRQPPLRVPSRVVFGPHGNRRELVDPPCQYLGFGPSAPVLWHNRSAAFSAASKAAQRRDFPC